MHPVRKQRLIIVVLLLLGVGGATAFILLALEENLNAFYTPKNIAASEVPLNRTIRLGGLVREGSVLREEGELKVRFVLADIDAEVAVEFEGILPDLFREGQGIVAIGKLHKTKSGSFYLVADEVLAKHDENYMSPELKAAMEAGGHPAKDTTDAYKSDQ